MQQIDFCVLKESTPHFAMRTACQITEKAFHAGLRVHIQTANRFVNEKLDNFLWTFRDLSFIPHQIFDGSELSCSVTLSTDHGPASAEVLVNISDKIPANFEQFQRIVEIIDHSSTSIHAGSERYRFYQENDLKLRHHEVFS